MMSPEHVILNGVDNVKIGLMKDALLFFIRELIEELGQPMQVFICVLRLNHSYSLFLLYVCTNTIVRMTTLQ